MAFLLHAGVFKFQTKLHLFSPSNFYDSCVTNRLPRAELLPPLHTEGSVRLPIQTTLQLLHLLLGGSLKLCSWLQLSWDKHPATTRLCTYFWVFQSYLETYQFFDVLAPYWFLPQERPRARGLVDFSNFWVLLAKSLGMMCLWRGPEGEELRCIIGVSCLLPPNYCSQEQSEHSEF